MKMANYLVKPDEGSIIYNGFPLESMKQNELRNLRKEVSYIFQEANLLENKTVYYHLSLIYKINKIKIDEESINNILDFMDIKRLKNSYCRELSGGQKQKVAIAMAILQNPKILLCDEISSALDNDAEKEIFDLLNKIIIEKDISVLIISHNLNVLKNFCDKILFIENNTIKDIIYPKKGGNKYDDNYYENVVRFLND